MEFRFTVPGVPCAKAKKLGTRAGHAFGYNDGQTAMYQNLVCLTARAARPDSWELPDDGLVSVRLVAIFPRPKRLLERSKRTGALLHGLEGRMVYRGKPDIDNLFKSVGDGLKRAGVWRDDSQVNDWDDSRRFYAAIGEEPHAEVQVAVVAGGEP